MGKVNTLTQHTWGQLLTHNTWAEGWGGLWGYMDHMTFVKLLHKTTWWTILNLNAGAKLIIKVGMLETY